MDKKPGLGMFSYMKETLDGWLGKAGGMGVLSAQQEKERQLLEETQKATASAAVTSEQPIAESTSDTKIDQLGSLMKEVLTDDIQKKVASGIVYDQIDSHKDALEQPKTHFNPEKPEDLFNQPDPRMGVAPKLKETGRVGAEANEGWLEYKTNRLHPMVVKEGKVAMKRRKYVGQDESMYGKAKDEGLWEFGQAMELPKDDSSDTVIPNGKKVGEGFASPKYHDRTVVTVETSDESFLADGGYEWFDVSTPQAIDDLVREKMSDCDPSVTAALYRLKLRMQEKNVPDRLKRQQVAEDADVHVSDMQDITPNWFNWRAAKQEDGTWTQYCVQGTESFAIPLLNKNTILLMSEETPAMAYKRYTTAVSGGWKAKKEPLPTTAAVRELQEEVGFTGDAIEIGTMHPNPDTQTTASVVNIVTNVHKFTGEAHGDEVTKILPKVVTREMFDAAIEKGEIVDDRTIAAVYMAFLYAEDHPELFEKKEDTAVVAPDPGTRT